MSLSRQLRIVIPGGTGRLGTLLSRHFYEQGHVVSTIARFPKAFEWEAIHWDAQNLGHWVHSLEGADAVINLAGRPTNCYQTAKNKAAILSSRVHSTELVGKAIQQCSCPPRVWLNASTVDIYPETVDELDESADAPGAFDAWESAVMSAPVTATRRVVLRIAPVMIPGGGIFEDLLRLVRRGIGGEMGDGEQYVAWIHDFDFVRAIEFLIQREDLCGAVNIDAPNPVPNHQFMCNLRRAWCTSYFGLRLPGWTLKAGASIVGTDPGLFLKSRRVVPRRLVQAGFSFNFPEWRGACENLVGRWRRSNES